MSCTNDSIGANIAQSGGIAQALQPFVDSRRLAGAVVLVADAEKILDMEAVGFADIAAEAPMRPDALFWIASQTKPITAAALMMLVEDGAVSLDAEVASYLPEFGDLWVEAERDDAHLLLRRPLHPPTVRQILSHTAGMVFASAMEQPTLDALPLRDTVRSYALTPLASEPGTRYEYSNAGINSAGRIIEVVSGMAFEQFLQTRLFDPLGMIDTTFWPDEAQLARLAKSYRPDGPSNSDLAEMTIGCLRYPLSDRTRGPVPGGGLFSTAADVARFCRMFLNRGELEGRRYLTEAAVDEMTCKQTGDSVPDDYGLGWAVGAGTFSHGGAYSTNMVVDTERGIATVFLVQHAGFPGDPAEMHAALARALEPFGRH